MKKFSSLVNTKLNHLEGIDPNLLAFSMAVDEIYRRDYYKNKQSPINKKEKIMNDTVEVFRNDFVIEQINGLIQKNTSNLYEEKEEQATPINLSSEAAERLRSLQSLLTDPRGNRRAVSIATENIMDEITNLTRQAPHFKHVISLIERQASVSFINQAGLSFPPILLVGEPGIGKTHFTKLLGKALDTSVHKIAMNSMSDGAMLLGHPISWKGAKQGKITRDLLDSKTASPLFVLDEIDKMQRNNFEDPYNPMLTLLERENAAQAMDEYLNVPFNLSQALFILTANDLSPIPEPVLDRMMIIEIDQPDEEQLQNVARYICRDAGSRLGFHGYNDINAVDIQVIQEIASTSPRQMTRLVDIAFGFAATELRHELEKTDIERAKKFMNVAKINRSIGFTVGISNIKSR